MSQIKNRVSKLEQINESDSFNIFLMLWELERKADPNLPEKPTDDWIEQQLRI